MPKIQVFASVLDSSKQALFLFSEVIIISGQKSIFTPRGRCVTFSASWAGRLSLPLSHSPPKIAAIAMELRYRGLPAESSVTLAAGLPLARYQRNVYRKLQVRENGDAPHLAGLCGDGGACPAYAGVQRTVPAAKREDRACICRCERKARHALHPVQRLGPGDKLGEA